MERAHNRDRERSRTKKEGPKKIFFRRKVCRFCADQGLAIDFKDTQTLKHFVTERGKIIPRRISGNCAKHQRVMAQAIKRCRHIALLPYTSQHNG